MELIDERIIELSELAKNKKEIVADWLRFVEENKMSICQFDSGDWLPTDSISVLIHSSCFLWAKSIFYERGVVEITFGSDLTGQNIVCFRAA